LVRTARGVPGAVGTPDQQLTGPLLQWIKALPAKG